MKAFKCLMGVGQGSRVRAANDNVLRRAGVRVMRAALLVVSSAYLCVVFFPPPPSSFLAPFSLFLLWFICVLLAYVHLS